MSKTRFSGVVGRGRLKNVGAPDMSLYTFTVPIVAYVLRESWMEAPIAKFAISETEEPV